MPGANLALGVCMVDEKGTMRRGQPWEVRSFRLQIEAGSASWRQLMG